MARATGSQFEIAIAAIGDASQGDDVGIHTARKSMKRLRAMLRMVKDSLGEDLYRRENVLLRDLSRSIAPARDGFVLIQTLDTVINGMDVSPYEAFRHRLRQEHDDQQAFLMGDSSFLPEVATELAAASYRIQGAASGLLPDESVHPIPAIVVKGIGRTYGRGRKGYERAISEPGDPSLHTWRKSVKYLRHQLESLELLIAPRLVHMTLELDELGELIGDHHDIEVLIDATRGMDGSDGEQLVKRGREIQDGLRRRALRFTLASGVYTPTKTAFKGAIEGI